MNRTDRLLGLILYLQSRRYATAADMAAHFGLSLRTIYRDMKALAEAGVPVLAEAGVGYSLMRGYLLPPVNFTEDEAMALTTGAMLLERAAAPTLSAHMESALQKVRTVLPPARREDLLRLGRAMGETALPPSSASPSEAAIETDLALVQKALARRQPLRFDYRGHGKSHATPREVEPLGLLRYLGHWHLIAWCRLRGALRDFRTDRMQHTMMLDEHFAPREAFDLAAYVREHMPRPELRATVRFHPDAVDRVWREWWMGVVDAPGAHPNSAQDSAQDSTRNDGSGRDAAPASVAENGSAAHTSHNGHPPSSAILILATVNWDHLAHWLLSFGPLATVLDPPHLRTLLAERAEATARHHRREPDLP